VAYTPRPIEHSAQHTRRKSSWLSRLRHGSFLQAEAQPGFVEQFSPRRSPAPHRKSSLLERLSAMLAINGETGGGTTEFSDVANSSDITQEDIIPVAQRMQQRVSFIVPKDTVKGPTDASNFSEDEEQLMREIVALRRRSSIAAAALGLRGSAAACAALASLQGQWSAEEESLMKDIVETRRRGSGGSFVRRGSLTLHAAPSLSVHVGEASSSHAGDDDDCRRRASLRLRLTPDRRGSAQQELAGVAAALEFGGVDTPSRNRHIYTRPSVGSLSTHRPAQEAKAEQRDGWSNEEEALMHEIVAARRQSSVAGLSVLPDVSVGSGWPAGAAVSGNEAGAAEDLENADSIVRRRAGDLFRRAARPVVSPMQPAVMPPGMSKSKSGAHVRSWRNR
jgi:hypothetical protein